MEQPLILDRYRPLDELGHGGFAAVVLAWDTRMQRRVAIKRLPLPVDARGIPQHPPGLTEARTAAMLNHPNIVTVFDFDTDNDEAFLVMEHVDGASLADLLDAAGGSLTLDEAAAVVGGAADALIFAHDNGVLHLDIKPENVLVTRDGRIKVADFGMAELSSLTGHGPAFGGTPGYMPIEQLEGSSVTEQTDEWALAVLAFEVLAGENPFADATLEAAVVKLETVEPPLVSEYVSDLPPELDSVLFAALGLRPDERYADVATFADEILPLLGDEAAGRTSLAELVDEHFDDATIVEPGLGRLGLWDRLQGRLGGLLVRAAAAVEAGWLAWAGLTPFSLEPLAVGGAVALVAAAGAFSPSLGVGLGMGCLIAGVLASGAWLAGAIVIVFGGAWWWFVARRHDGAAVLPLAGPVLAAARFAPAQPLLSGFALRPWRAAVTALLGGVLTLLASAASASDLTSLSVWAPYALNVWDGDLALAGIRRLATSPEAYIVLAGWPISAVIMSVACRRATRLGALAGAIAGAAAIAGCYYLAESVAISLGHPHGWLGVDVAFSVGGSLILMVLVVIMGPPIRAEEDAEYETEQAE